MSTATSDLVVDGTEGVLIGKQIRYLLLGYLILCIIFHAPKHNSCRIETDRPRDALDALGGDDAADVTMSTVEEELCDYVII